MIPPMRHPVLLGPAKLVNLWVIQDRDPYTIVIIPKKHVIPAKAGNHCIADTKTFSMDTDLRRYDDKTKHCYIITGGILNLYNLNIYLLIMIDAVT